MLRLSNLGFKVSIFETNNLNKDVHVHKNNGMIIKKQKGRLKYC